MKKINVYQMVTDRIVSELEKGVIPWRKPWSGVGLSDGGSVNYVSRKPYSMLNQMLLGREGEYLTFKQINDLGGSIKKGAKGEIVVFFTQVKYTKKTEENQDTEEKKKEYTVPLLRYYHVYHIDDTIGILSKIKVEELQDGIQPIERAEAVINGYLEREKSLKFHNDRPTDKAYYSPTTDTVNVPMMSQYQIKEEYYSTTFHELTHSTLIASRCDRSSDRMGISAFGSDSYSREELVAEIGSAMLCNHSGLDCEMAFKNSVAYIKGWLSKLKSDDHAIVWAASRAEKAAKFILGVKEQKGGDDE